MFIAPPHSSSTQAPLGAEYGFYKHAAASGAELRARREGHLCVIDLCNSETGHLINEIEDVPLFESDIEFPQQRYVFALKRLPLMVPLLILNVPNDHIQL